MRLISFFLSFIFCFCTQVFGQTSNDTIPIDSSKNILEKTLDIFEFKIGNITCTTYPALNVDPSSGLNLGVMQVFNLPAKKDSLFSRSTSLVNHFTYSTEQWLNLKSDLVLYTPKGLNITMYAQYLQAPDKFYGIGEDSLNTNPAKFYIHDTEVRGNISKSIFSKYFGGILLDISHTKTESLQVSSSGLSVPLQKSNLLIGIGPHMSYDTRNNVNYPTKGSYVALAYIYFPQLAPNKYYYNSIYIDARKYITLYKDLVLATHLYSGLSNGDVPFYEMFQLGGKSRLRGISNKYMYIDKHIYYTQAELRKHVWGRFSVVGFGGIGNTANEDFIYNNPLKYVYGGGIRFQTSKTEKLHLRIDYGKGKFGDSGLYITVREAF